MKASGQHKTSARKGFTLIELLVVIVIIALLLAITIPAMKAAKEMAKKVICLAHMRGTGSMVLVYARNHDDQFPYAGLRFRDDKGANYYLYKQAVGGNGNANYSETDPDPARRAGPTSLGYLYKGGLMDSGSDLVFCPSMIQLFGQKMPSPRWNAKGETSHWNYIGLNYGPTSTGSLASYDTEIGWINCRVTIGNRWMEYFGFKTVAEASLKGKRAYLSDLWAARQGTYFQTRETDIPHRMGSGKSMNVWYIDGHAENVRMKDEFFEKILDPDGNRYLDATMTWAIMFD